MCRIRRSRVAAILIVLACLTIGLPMVASASPGAPGDGSQSFDSPSADFPLALCAFPIHVDITGKTKVNSFADGTHSVVIAPQQYAQITNTTNGKQVSFNITGSFHDVTENGVTTEHFTGRNLTWDETTGFVLIIGNWYWQFTDSGITQHLTGVGGKISQICPLIE